MGLLLVQDHKLECEVGFEFTFSVFMSLARLGLDPGFLVTWPIPALRLPYHSSLTLMVADSTMATQWVISSLSEFPLRRVPWLPAVVLGLVMRQAWDKHSI